MAFLDSTASIPCDEASLGLAEAGYPNVYGVTGA